MLEIVVICLLTQFCLRLWAQLRRRFELWDTEVEEILNYDENELEESEVYGKPSSHLEESKENKDQQDTKCQRRRK